MNEETKSEMNQLILALKEETGRIGELSSITNSQIKKFRGPTPSVEDKKIDEYEGIIGAFRMQILYLQKHRMIMEETLKELNIIVGG